MSLVPGPPQSATSLKQWIIENNISTVDPCDSIYTSSYPPSSGAPWTKDPHYFQKVKISAIALIKMVIHARKGAPLEVMGLMHGKVIDRTMVVLDAFALPVEGTETRVNAQQEAFEYMVQYQQSSSEAGRTEHILGWYHSHPGYGCWLSGIDVSTQLTNQQYQEPFLAIVVLTRHSVQVDPNRTVSAGRVEIGAFRTYPANYLPPKTKDSAGEYQSIPLSKIEDFGVHANQYYSLEIEIFKSKLDTQLLELLWNKHWISTLSSTSYATNKDYLVSQLADVTAKLDRINVANATSTPKASSSKPRSSSSSSSSRSTNEPVDEFGKVSCHATKVVTESMHSILSQAIKQLVFNKIK